MNDNLVRRSLTRRLFRGLDILTIKWAICDSPEECRFLLNTQLMFLKREKDPTTKLSDEDEWIWLTDGSARNRSRHPRSKLSTRKRYGPFKWENYCGNMSRGFISKTQRRRNRSPHDSNAATRSWISRCAEALAIFHQLICDEWASGSLNAPVVRIKVDETNCFDMIEWNAARKAAAHFLPKHTATAGWKHRKLSR